MLCLPRRLYDTELVAMNTFEIESGIERLLTHDYALILASALT